jgi:DNA-binding transcriptional MerR regulator
MTSSRSSAKSAGAFRTISEVASDLDVPQHVLRFWESKFSQVKPLKRGGGRRYYRPEDVDLLRRIRDLLYVQGYTIKGVQRLLRDGTLKAGGTQDRSPAAADEGPSDPRSELRAILKELTVLRDALRRAVR